MQAAPKKRNFADSEVDRTRLLEKLRNLRKEKERKRSKVENSSEMVVGCELKETQTQTPVPSTPARGSGSLKVVADEIVEVPSDLSSETHSVSQCSEEDEQAGPPGALEIFAGCGALTAELQKAGFAAVGVDYKNKDKPRAKIIWIDLTTRAGQLEFWALVRAGQIRYVHFAPPCGTASRAREIRRRGIDPKPLRSQAYPEGVPDLNAKDAARVDSANILYKFVAEAIPKLDERGIAWSVENPTNSWMWQTRWFLELQARHEDPDIPFHCSRISFDMCMHGGKRKKATVFLFGGGIDLAPLELKCDGNHEHLPWGVSAEGSAPFVTAGERNYPQTLCRRIAKRAALACGAKARQKYVENPDKIANLEDQPRRSQNELIAEFKDVRTIAEVTKEESEDLLSWKSKGGLVIVKEFT